MPPRSADLPSCLIIDDHPVVRQGVSALLESTWSGAEVANAPDLESALESTNGAKPDVVIVDPWRAGADIGELVKRLSKGLGAPIVVFTLDGGARLLSEGLKAGVKGYVRKDSPPIGLIRGL